ncbi:MAG: outer membrane protein assembly factor BamD, partial [Pseudomonadota bacterium]|nr:outer membrane protein assembly factor BamD [Pseudomonadota bacterium]
KITQQALDSLGELIRRYPQTRYAADARLKVDLVNDHLAGKEMEVGRFYQRRGQWLAATLRFRTVIDKYQTTTHTPEALERLVESYLSLGIPTEAQKAAAVLGRNYPGTKWYERSYKLMQEHGGAA